MKKFGFWFMNARPQALPQSVIPTVVAVCMAFAGSDDGNWLCAVLALVGVVCAHLSTNLLDDYFDYRNAGNLHKPEMEHVRSSIERSVEFLTGRKPRVKGTSKNRFEKRK